MKCYRCPKCGHCTLQYNGLMNTLYCSHIEYSIEGEKSCDFKLSMSKQNTPPNDGQILVVLAKYK